jgi:sialate O-acetylesterase
LLPVMIASWRSAFGDADLPVAIVETRPHHYAVPFGLDGRLAAELREAQRAAANKAQAHIVTTIDLQADPTAREVAPRIVDVLQGRGRSGPVLAGSQTQGDKVILRFTETRGGLKAKGGELRGFAIAWSLFRWVWADARIEGDTVIVSAPGLSKPDGVRYAYEDLPSRGATLTDAEGAPAAPFRTDTHLSVTGLNLDPGAEVLR